MTIPQELQNSFIAARELVGKHQRVIVASHEFTDGDDLGAVLAFSKVLEDWGKGVVRLARGGVPDSLLFLPDLDKVVGELPADYQETDLLITIGCGSLARTGFDELAKWQKPILNIDHHADSKMFGTVNVWDESAAANCELVYQMLESWGVEMDKAIAQDLLTGIFTDTGGFRHANVRALTLEIAAQLLRHGAKLDLISRFTTSQKDATMLRAWALALENARFDRDRQLAYTVITEDDLKRIGSTEEDLEGVVELLNTIPDAKFSMLLKQRGDEVKGSLRSENYKGVDVSKIARAFGGGGHKLAAGFKFKGKIEKTPEGWKIS